MGDLAAALAVSTPTATGIVDRLVGRGDIARGHDSEDRRVVTCFLTDQGQEHVSALYLAKFEVFREIFGTLTPEELDVVVKAEEVVITLFAPLLHQFDPQNLGKDPKTLLQEYLQSRKLMLPQYSVVITSGEAHQQQFHVECVIPKLNIRAMGEGASRRSAEQEAAKRAYEQAHSHC
ncbi:MAG: MarR family transcriptional regulator [Proteobacteria bacterium]|nr:MarR family transcriptional regulator [Pseudomonadota bacterium]